MKLNKVKSVYIVLNPEINIVKVGTTSNIKEQINKLQNSSGTDIKLIHITQPLTNYIEIENKVNAELSEYRTFGGWLNVSSDIAVNVLQSLSDVYDIDSIIKKVSSGEKINDIAKQCEVSRQTISKRIKGSRTYHPEPKKIEPTKRIEPENKEQTIVDITKYKRVGKGRYTDKDGNVVLIEYKEGKFYIV